MSLFLDLMALSPGERPRAITEMETPTISSLIRQCPRIMVCSLRRADVLPWSESPRKALPDDLAEVEGLRIVSLCRRSPADWVAVYQLGLMLAAEYVHRRGRSHRSADTMIWIASQTNARALSGRNKAESDI